MVCRKLRAQVRHEDARGCGRVPRVDRAQVLEKVGVVVVVLDGGVNADAGERRGDGDDVEPAVAL